MNTDFIFRSGEDLDFRRFANASVYIREIRGVFLTRIKS